MSPTDIVFAITQAVRLGQAIKDYREAEILKADIKIVVGAAERLSDDDFLMDALSNRAAVLEAIGEAEAFLPQSGGIVPECPPALRDQIIAFGRQAFIQRQAASAANADGPAVFMLDKRSAEVIEAFRATDRRPSPLHRLGLAALQIALETAAANPRLFNASPNGEKIITSMLTNVIALLPDPENASHWQVGFAQRTATILMAATARVVDQNADAIWSQPRLQELGRALTSPLRARLEQAVSPQAGAAAYQIRRLENIREELLAPMVHAALGAVARYQQETLGASFATDSLLGAVTEQFLKTALDDTEGPNVLRAFSKQGFVHVYERVLGLAAEKPGLFIHGLSSSTDMARSVLAASAAALQGAPAPYGRDVAAQVTAAALEAVATNLPTLMDVRQSWDKVGVSVLQNIVQGFAAGVRGRDPNTFARVFSRDQAVGLVRLVAEQVALTPGMIVGEEANPEVQRIAAHVAGLIAAPGASLISATQWTGLVSALLVEASANPGALFSLDDGRPEQQLAVNLISDLFGVAAAAYDAGGRRPGLRLFGATLAESAATVARAAVRNVAKASTEAGRSAARNLAQRLTALALAYPGKVSDHDWRFLYGNWIVQVIEMGALPSWSDDQLLSMLYIENHGEGAAASADDQPVEGGQT